VKPVLFAHWTPVPQESPLIPPDQPDVSWTPPPPPNGATAIVLDLPGAAGVRVAIALAQQGYRPVPLYNALPRASGAVCDMMPIVLALGEATRTLASLNLAIDAPPAFLLDADRRVGTGVTPTPGMYDNRSVSLPTDFPSANLLLSRGIRSALLVQHTDLSPQADLSHTLVRWQQAGIEIRAVTLLGAERTPMPIIVRKPWLFRVMFQRMVATMGLRRDPLGGFGGVLPIPSSAG
jgi:hypothetical protein